MNTDIINKFLKEVKTINPSVDVKTLPFAIDAVCNVGPEWDYHFYEVPEEVHMKVDSRIAGKDSLWLLETQNKFLIDSKFVHHKIEINQWDSDKSFFNTLALPKKETGSKTRGVFGAPKLYSDSKIHLFGETPQIDQASSDEADPEAGSRYKFPGNYSCVFRSEAYNIAYDVKSTSKIALVQPRSKSNTWKTKCVSQPLDMCHFPAVQEPTLKAQVEERRVYVKNNEVAATTVQWNENNQSYWLTVVSSPDTPDDSWLFGSLVLDAQDKLAKWGNSVYDSAKNLYVAATTLKSTREQ